METTKLSEVWGFSLRCRVFGFYVMEPYGSFSSQEAAKDLRA